MHPIVCSSKPLQLHVLPVQRLRWVQVLDPIGTRRLDVVADCSLLLFKSGIFQVLLFVWVSESQTLPIPVTVENLTALGSPYLYRVV